MSKLIYITGGARSGKSSFAEDIVNEYSKVKYIATAAVTDNEMLDRIKKHQSRRPSEWITVEEQKKIYRYINNKEPIEAILVDCIAVWVSNLLLYKWDNETNDHNTIINYIKTETKILLKEIKCSKSLIVLVSNEVGSGVVPAYELGRLYRDCLGIVNQMIAKSADKVFYCVSGIPMQIKGEKHEK